MTEFDYDAFFNDLESGDTLSTHTSTSSPSTIVSDGDSGIGATTPPMNSTFENTAIDLNDLDFWPFNLNQQDQNDEFQQFLNEQETTLLGETTTFEDFFSKSPEQIIQESASSPVPVLLPNSPSVPAITNCIKVPSPNPTVGSCIKLEPMTNGKPTIKIISATAPVVVPASIIPIPTVKIDEANPSSTKRRRSESPKNEKSSTLTMEQLRAQYGNMSEEALKKHLRMIKNRESASLSRKRRKELMENLDTRVKRLTDENEQLKRENNRLQTQVQTLTLENQLLKQYRVATPSQPGQKSLILKGLVVLVVFNILVLKMFIPSISPQTLSSIDYSPSAVVPSRTILNAKDSEASYSIEDYDVSPSTDQKYPYLQCVAFINKTHSKRINQDLRSFVEEFQTKPKMIEQEISSDTADSSESKSLTIPAHPSQHHLTRKMALHQQRQAKVASESKGQLQPYRSSVEANFDEFIHAIDRKNNTIYLVSFKRDHLILPATIQNQTERPKMSIVLPASMANLNKSIQIPSNHVPMIKIDCEVDDTKLVFIKRSQIPPSYRHDLFQYYSSVPQSPL